MINSHYNCNAGLASWEHGWSTAKKTWCCKQGGHGCNPYDCNAGFTNLPSLWTPAKRAWCCNNKHLGCTTTTHLRYDCNAGLAHWEQGWSTNKKKWCCKHEGHSCDPYDCNFNLASSTSLSPSAERIWCCRNRQIGCTTTNTAPTTTSSAPYECNVGLAKWEHGWSIAKKAWCCANEGYGCDPHDCDGKLIAGVGCKIANHVPYNCHAGVDDLETGWSVGKKIWCCKFHQLGCPMTTSTGLGAANTINRVASQHRGRKHHQHNATH